MLDLLATLIFYTSFEELNISLVQKNLISQQVNHTNHLRVKNFCDVSVEMYIRYKNKFYGWENVHFVAPPSYDGFIYSANDQVYLESDNSFFYIYAETITKSYYWSGDHKKYVSGREIPFQERYLTRSQDNNLPPHWELAFSCPLY